MSGFRIRSRWSDSGGTERTDIDTGQDQQTSQHQSDPDRLAVKPGRELDCPGAANVARKPPPDSVTPTGLRDGAGAAGRIDSRTDWEPAITARTRGTATGPASHSTGVQLS
jgi:hypothetical protein